MSTPHFAIFEHRPAGVLHREYAASPSGLCSPEAYCWASYMLHRCYGFPIIDDLKAFAAQSFELEAELGAGEAPIIVNGPLLAHAIERVIFAAVWPLRCSPEQVHATAFEWLENEPEKVLAAIRDMVCAMSDDDWHELSGFYCTKH